MPSYLLDKSFARRTVEGFHHLDDLSYEEELVLELWRKLQDEQARLFIPSIENGLRSPDQTKQLR
jgi:hypothetical protein